MNTVRDSIEKAVEYLTENPDDARYTDSHARAELASSLRVLVTGPDGESLTTDMPGAVGGRDEELSPGWLYRASVASCVASTIGMETARAGVDLDSLVVEVDGESDDRGILGMDDSTPAGPLSLSVRVRARADVGGMSELEDLIERGVRRCPVFDATQRGVEVSVDIDVD